MRKALALAGLAGLLALTAACGKKAADGTTPAGNKIAAAAKPTLGPDGHAVSLGDSADKVAAAGWKVTDNPSDPVCSKAGSYPAPGGGGEGDVTISAKDGVTSIRVVGSFKQMHTPEGIRQFSTLADVTKAYPSVKVSAAAASAGTDVAIPVPGHANATYKLHILDNQVFSLVLALNNNRC